MPKPGTSANPPARCPRCNYDLSGHIAAWTDQCPTRGQCSECGLEFNWGDVLNAAMRDLPWLYEHAPHWWHVRRAWSTAFRALAPWHFWKHVELHHRIRTGRLLCWLPCAVAVSYVLALIAVALSLGAHRLFLPLPTPILTNLNPATSPQSLTLAVAPNNRELILTTDDHSVRLPLPSQSYFEPRFHQTPLGPVFITPGNSSGRWRVEAPPTYDTKWTLVSPDGAAYTNPFTLVSVRRPYAPAEPNFHDIAIAPLLGSFTPNRASYGLGASFASRGFVGTSFNPAIAGLLAFILVSGCIVAAAPTEWKRSKVRTGHLIRVLVYSASPFVLLMTLHFLIWVWAEIGLTVWNISNFPVPFGARGPRGPNPWIVPPRSIALFASNRTQPHIAIALAVWLPLFWWFAFKRGMKLEHPIVLWLFVTIGGLLAYVITLNAMDTFFTHLFI